MVERTASPVLDLITSVYNSGVLIRPLNLNNIRRKRERRNKRFKRIVEVFQKKALVLKTVALMQSKLLTTIFSECASLYNES